MGCAESTTSVKDLKVPSGTYTGDFDSDKGPHGNGTIVFHDGSTYGGGWRSGLIHGDGRYTMPDGTSVSGEWTGGRLTNGLISIPSGSHPQLPFFVDDFRPPCEAAFRESSIAVAVLAEAGQPVVITDSSPPVGSPITGIGRYTGKARCLGPIQMTGAPPRILRHGEGTFTEPITGHSCTGRWEDDTFVEGEMLLGDELLEGEFPSGLLDGHGIARGRVGDAPNDRFLTLRAVFKAGRVRAHREDKISVTYADSNSDDGRRTVPIVLAESAAWQDVIATFADEWLFVDDSFMLRIDNERPPMPLRLNLRRRQEDEQIVKDDCNSALAASSYSPAEGTRMYSELDSGAEAPAEQQDAFCMLCRTAKRSHLILPCGHLCLCGDCAEFPELDRCPVCYGEAERKALM